MADATVLDTAAAGPLSEIVRHGNIEREEAAERSAPEGVSAEEIASVALDAEGGAMLQIEGGDMPEEGGPEEVQVVPPDPPHEESPWPMGAAMSGAIVEKEITREENAGVRPRRFQPPAAFEAAMQGEWRMKPCRVSGGCSHAGEWRLQPCRVSEGCSHAG